MRAEQFEALRRTVEDGQTVSFDGLAAGYDDTTGHYRLATPERERTGLSESEFHDAAEDASAHVTNWYFWHTLAPDGAARRAFCRWLESAAERDVSERYDALETGTTRSWGQLRVSVRLDEDGTRRYEIRHEDDADRDVDALETYDDPLEARRLAKYDDDERYRPLKTAPTLRTGWVYPDLGPAECAETVEFLYPATVANWYREREGELDVTHWEDAIGRQTGMYGVIETWNRGDGHEHVEWVAEACCDDSQCLKRREWEYDEDTDLDVDGGDGVFPCREPCSLVIAAARKFTKLEGEESRTYEFELTPSEKEQLEAIVDAVADGRTDEIREADIYDGANRYRARFLRAKLFDDDGDLDGVPTDPDADDESDPDGDDEEHDA